MTRPKLLDRFCCEGGASEGYRRAGFDVYGIDLFKHARNGPDGQPLRDRNGKVKKFGFSRDRYPFPAYQGDAMEALERLLYRGPNLTGVLPFTHKDGTVEYLGLDDFDAIHSSPPCQGYSRATAGNKTARAGHQRLIAAERELLEATGLPWVIENVEQAKSEMCDPITLCGRMFGLEATDADGLPLVLDRHRLFESNVELSAPPHLPHDGRQVAGVYGGSRHADRFESESLAEVAPRDRDAARFDRGGGYVPRSKAVQQQLLGIDWMTKGGMAQSLPPIYCQHIGLQLAAHIGQDVAA